MTAVARPLLRRLRRLRRLVVQAFAGGLAWAACDAALALDPKIRLDELHHTAWTAKDGLPGAVRSMGQGDDGYLWVQTGNGLFRFDGVAFEPILALGGQSLRGMVPLTVDQMADGELWLGFAGDGMARLRDGRFEKMGSSSEHGAVYQIVKDLDGAVWSVSSGRLRRLVGQQQGEVGAAWGFPETPTMSLAVDPLGTLWAANQNRLYFLRRGARRFEPAGAGAVAEVVSVSRDGTVWAAGDHGVYAIAKGGVVFPRAVQVDAEPSDAPVMDREGSLWMSHATGLVRMRVDLDALGRGQARPAIERFGVADGLSSNTVHKVFEDREGNIWVGTSAGIDRFRNNRIVNVALPPRRDVGYAITPSTDGAVWVGCWDNCFYRTDGSEVRVLKAPGAGNIRVLYVDPAGALWLGGGEGLWRTRDGVDFENARAPDETVGDTIRSITTDQSGDLWVGGSGTGRAARLSHGRWDFPGGSAGLSDRWTFRASLTDSEGHLWFGAGDSITQLRDGVARSMSIASSGLDVGFVATFFERRGHVWVGGTNGVALFDGTRFRGLTGEGGEAFPMISGIVETASGDLWLNSFSETLRIRAADLKAALAHPGTPVHPDRLDELDGRKGSAGLANPHPSLVEGSDGRIWIATTSGVAWIDPRTLDVKPRMPAVLLKGVTVDGKEYAVAPTLTFPALNQHLEVSYAATDLSMPERIRFRYRLDGIDSDWQLAGGRRVAFYNNLGPGRYRFDVASTDEDGNWSPSATSFAFDVLPAWYQTAWFKALCTAAVLVVGWIAYRLRLGKLTRRMGWQLKTQILERERIARELHDTLLQSFYGLLMQFYSVAEKMPEDDPEREHLSQVLERADQALLEGRESVHNLRGLSQENLKLAQIVALAKLEISGDSQARLHLTTIGTEVELHPVVIEQLTGVLREALRNAFRHAGAENVRLQFVYTRKLFRVILEDDGRGIPPEVLRDGRAKHWGLLGMRERVNRIGGHLEIASKPGRGTRIELRLRAAIAFRRPEGIASRLFSLRKRLALHGVG